MTTSQSPRVGIRDVALAAGVSIATVSNVYNRRGKISETTRRKVMAVGDRLGYRPNQTGQALRSGRTNVLAVVASFRDPAVAEASFMPCFRSIVAGAAAGAAEAGYAITIGRATADGRVDTRLSHDGIIIVDPMPSDPIVERELALGTPVVAVGGYGSRPGAKLSSVRLDVRGGLPKVLDDWAQFAGGGENRPTMFLGPRLDHFTNDAVAAFQGWCAEHGISAQGGALEPGEALLDAAVRLLSAKVRPTAVQCMNESYSAAVLHAAAQLGVAVPEELRVATIGNPNGLGAQVGVDYLATDPVENGALAATLMVELLQGEAAESMSLPLPLIPRRQGDVADMLAS
ncbi:LacI family DNA-binding transcriptional regulator [Agromyces sp. NPDC060279]|uniref:LacI family DNA-binding transcriptional regulator n=1 Tax=Agromyces sp. NPDC060279 TaxID=3347092 RepID=UPI0036494EC5